MTPSVHNKAHFTDAQAAQTPSNALSQLGVHDRAMACAWAGWAPDAAEQRLEGEIKEREPNGSIVLVLLMFLGAVEFVVVPRELLRH